MIVVLKLYTFLVVFLFCVFEIDSSCPCHCKNNSPRRKNRRSQESSKNSGSDGGLTCVVAPPYCEKSRYRTIDGLCNNFHHPTWGAAQTPYASLLPNKYGDGLGSFPRSITGRPLPNARVVRRHLFPEKVVFNINYTLITMQWGQVTTHDMSLNGGVPQTGKMNITCCDANGDFNEEAKTNPRCAPIKILKSDPVYGPINKVCMDFVRTVTTRSNNCTASCVPGRPLSSVTAYLDLSLVYGNDKTTEESVRAFSGGRLKSVKRNGQEWPPQDPQVNLTCVNLDSPTSPCYFTGDVRVNQNTQLTLLQVVLLREHNRIAGILSQLNPHWCDEKIFQETRRILIAISQKITYYQYLPIILGYENMVKHKLIYPHACSYVNDYDPNVDASVLNEHATSSFRYFHSNIQGILEKYSKSRNMVGDIHISDHFNNPKVLEQGDNFSDLARGLTVQPEAEGDKYFDEEIVEKLFKGDGELGDDLRTIDIHRSRDHGVPSYKDTRAACGLSVPVTFSDMEEYIPAESVKIMEELYESVEDLDLLVAGSLEKDAPGSQLGPLFLNITTTQFYRTRVGDRYFFENGADPEIAFTPCQLQSIREGASLARLLCDNVPGILSIQPDVFKLISDTNQVVPCDTLPAVDLNLWKEEA